MNSSADVVTKFVELTEELAAGDRDVADARIAELGQDRHADHFADRFGRLLSASIGHNKYLMLKCSMSKCSMFNVLRLL